MGWRSRSPAREDVTVPRADPHRAPAARSSAPMSAPRSSPAGYSGTPLHRKLGIAPGHRVLAWQVPEGFPLTALNPDGAATVLRRPAGRSGGGPGSGGYDVVLL